MEQIAFAPSNMIPGIEPSPDKMLQVTREVLSVPTQRQQSAMFPLRICIVFSLSVRRGVFWWVVDVLLRVGGDARRAWEVFLSSATTVICLPCYKF